MSKLTKRLRNRYCSTCGQRKGHGTFNDNITAADRIDELEAANAQRKSINSEMLNAAVVSGNPNYQATIEQLKANNKNLIDRNALLRERHDLPVDRIPAHKKLIELEEKYDKLKDINGALRLSVMSLRHSWLK